MGDVSQLLEEAEITRLKSQVNLILQLQYASFFLPDFIRKKIMPRAEVVDLLELQDRRSRPEEITCWPKKIIHQIYNHFALPSEEFIERLKDCYVQVSALSSKSI